MAAPEQVNAGATGSLAGRRVLVTGAGGFIGSHLVEHLVQRGCAVRAFVRYTSRGTAGFLDQSETASEVEIVLGDLRDGDAVRAAAAGTEIVFHLGALIGIPYSYVHPQETVETNVLGTLNVLLADAMPRCSAWFTPPRARCTARRSPCR